mgnify:CR=1 FL=1
MERDYPQLIQIKNGVTTAYKDPINQVIRQKNLFLEWLQLNDFPDIPIEHLVVIANQYAIIKASPQHFSIFDVLINSDYLSLKIEKLSKSTNLIYSIKMNSSNSQPFCLLLIVPSKRISCKNTRSMKMNC